MSRLIKKTILIPEKVEVLDQGKEILLKGPLGSLSVKKLSYLKIELENNEVKISMTNNSRQAKMNSGTMWSLIKNAIIGVTQGFEKILEIEGIGYKAEVKGKDLVLNLGFSHPVNFPIPEGTEIKTEKNLIIIKGIDKQLVGETASKIRKLKPPEPYKGKGIHYQGEYIRRKAGKKAGSVSSA